MGDRRPSPGGAPIEADGGESLIGDGISLTGAAANAAGAQARQPEAGQDTPARLLPGTPLESLRRAFVGQGSFIFLPEFLSADATAQLVAAAAALQSSVNRNYLPGHKQGGSVARHVIDERAPFIAELYRSRPLIDLLEGVAGESLQLSPPDDPHAYALYYYTRLGDHIGWHYDTSYYVGRRYTLLLGVIDESSCRLDYELHTRETGAAVVPGSIRIPPGGLVFFDGDALRHRITPLGEGERRVSLTFEYVTDPRMRRGWGMISKMKDALGYFGFRQVFGRRPRAGQQP